MPEAVVSSKIISYGKNRYRFSTADSHWEVMMWGWWYNGGDEPQWRWMTIPDHKVPDKVKEVTRR